MPGVVFAGHAGGASSHPIGPVHEPGSPPCGTHTGVQLPFASHVVAHA